MKEKGIRSGDPALWAFLLLNIVIRVTAALRPLQIVDNLAIFDDSYLSLTIARNIAHGLGPLYGEALTNGFQPLYVLMMAPVYHFFPDDPFVPVRIALLVLAAFDSLTLYLLFGYVSRMSRHRAVARVIALAWTFSPYVIRTTLNCLETTISVFFIVATFAAFELRRERPGVRDLFPVGLLAGVAALARIDNCFLLVAMLTILAWQHRRSMAHALPPMAAIAAGFALVVLPWFLVSYSLSGDWFPVSGKAVRFNSLADVQHHPTITTFYLPVVVHALRVLVKHNWVHGLAVASLAALLWLHPSSRRWLQSVRWKPILPFFLFSGLLVLAYTGYIQATWFFERYLYPVALCGLLAVAVVLDAAVSHSPKWVRPGWLATATAAVIVVLNLQQPYFRDVFLSAGGNDRGYMNIGIWARDHLPDGTVVGAQQSGAIGYFAQNLRVFNLDGVVNAECYRSLEERRNMEYIKARGIRYMLGWKVDSVYVAMHSAEMRPGDLEAGQPVRGFRSWGQEWYLFKVNHHGM